MDREGPAVTSSDRWYIADIVFFVIVSVIALYAFGMQMCDVPARADAIEAM